MIQAERIVTNEQKGQRLVIKMSGEQRLAGWGRCLPRPQEYSIVTIKREAIPARVQ